VSASLKNPITRKLQGKKFYNFEYRKFKSFVNCQLSTELSANVIELFSSLLTERVNKLERLSPSSLFPARQYLQARPGA
jgi:hypothetical protein